MYFKSLIMGACIIGMQLHAAIEFRYGDDDYFKFLYAHNIDRHANGGLKLMAAEGMIFLAAQHNPKQLITLLERYKKYTLYDAWNQALLLAIENQHFEHAVQLLEHKDIKCPNKFAREKLLSKLMAFLERTPAPCDKPRESWQPELVKSCMRESELARQRTRKRKYAACRKLVEILEAPDHS